MQDDSAIDSLDALSPEEQKRQAERELAENAAAMDAFGDSLMSSLHDAISFRNDFERDWQKDISQFEYGDPNAASSSRSKDAPSESDSVFKRAKNITKKAVITYAARLSDMLFPTNDRNCDLDNTPDPQIPEEVLQTALSEIQQNNPEAQIDDALIDTVKVVVAKKRAAKMRTLIDDRLMESRYSAH